MKKICVFTLYSERGASSHYRIYIYKDMIDKNFEAVWYSFWNDNYTTKYMFEKKKYLILILFNYLMAVIKRIYYILFIATRCDIVFIQKALIPKCKINFLNVLKRKNIKIVYDVDDAVFLNKNDNSNEIASLSDTVICGNEILKKHYSKFNSNCVFIPTIEQTYKYKPYWKNTFENKIIGWIGSKSTIDNLDLIVNPINEIVEKYPNVKFHIICNTDLDYTKKIKNSEFIVWNKEDYIEKMSDITIGIMPLKDNEFNRGKCGFKLIQYLNMKKPVIASDVGINSKIVDNNGFIATKEKEWKEYIEQLLFDKKIYEEKLNKIESDFFCKYDFDIISNKLKEILS